METDIHLKALRAECEANNTQDRLPPHRFNNPILQSAFEAGELTTDDRFAVILCPHSLEERRVVAIIDEDEPNGYLCLHNCDDDGSEDFSDVKTFNII